MFRESGQICCIYFTLYYIRLLHEQDTLYVLFFIGKNMKPYHNTICLWQNFFGFLFMCGCVRVCLLLVLTFFCWTVWLPKDKFSVQLQWASSDSEVWVYSVAMLGSQSCSSYCFLLQKMLYDRLREPFSSLCTLKLFSFTFEVAAVSFILDTFVRCFHTF